MSVLKHIEIQTDRFGRIRHILIDGVENPSVKAIEVSSHAGDAMADVRVTFVATIDWRYVPQGDEQPAIYDWARG